MQRLARVLIVLLLAIAPLSVVVPRALADVPPYYPNWQRGNFLGNNATCAQLTVITWQCANGGTITSLFAVSCSSYTLTVEIPFLGVLNNEPGPPNLTIYEVPYDPNTGNQIGYVQVQYVQSAGSYQFIETANGNHYPEWIQIQAGYDIQFNVQISVACAAPPAPTATVNPSFTPTPTIAPGSPLPTNTPRTAGGTYTPTPNSTPATSTPTPTATPPIPERDCGDVTFPLLNCDWVTGLEGVTTYAAGVPIPSVFHWQGSSIAVTYRAFPCTWSGRPFNCTYGPTDDQVLNIAIQQPVVPSISGELRGLFHYYITTVNATNYSVAVCGTICKQLGVYPPATGTQELDLGPVTAGLSVNLQFAVCNSVPYPISPVALAAGGYCSSYFNPEFGIDTTWIGAAGATNTPVPPTNTVTPTPTITPGGPTLTPTSIVGTATNTPIRAIVLTPTPIAMATMCWDACSPFQLSPIPNIVGTQISIPTGPLSYLTTLSLGRTPCTSFGKVPILVPHITPVGSLTPLSYAWGYVTPVAMSTVVFNSGVISGTDIIPCADPQIPTTVWDSTWYGSLMLIFMCFVGWLIWFVHRLFNNQGTAD